MKAVILAVFLVGTAAAAIEGYTRTEKYHGHQVFTCTLPYATNETGPLDQLVHVYDLDVYGSSVPGTVDIRVKNAYERKAVLAHFKQNCVMMVEDVEAQVLGWEQEWEAALANQSSFAGDRNLLQGADWFTNYRRYADIVSWYRTFAAANPAIATFVPSIGQSSQGREMPAIVLTTAPAAGRRAIYVQCQIHAREWIAGATCNFIVNEIALAYNAGDAVVRGILSRAAIHLVPFVNPDGYEFTHTNSRLWRKSRSAAAPGSTCIGTDINRNYNENWGRGGSSTNPCAENYMGRSAASEPETQNTQNYFHSIAPVLAAIDMHSYSQMLLRPFGCCQTIAPHEAQQARVGTAMVAAIRASSGRNYQSLRSVQLAAVTGEAGDWFYGVDATARNLGFRASGWTFELRPAGANPGFQLPPAEIVPTGREVFEAFKVFCNFFIDEPLRP